METRLKVLKHVLEIIGINTEEQIYFDHGNIRSKRKLINNTPDTYQNMIDMEGSKLHTPDMDKVMTIMHWYQTHFDDSGGGYDLVDDSTEK